MLDPDYLERAGDLVAGVYSEIEADMCDHLVRAILAGDVSDWRSQTALQLLAQGQAPQIHMVLERYRDKINEAVRREVEEALARSDAHDLAVVKRALGIDLPKVSTQQVALAVKTICEMLERDNVDLMNGARDAFFRETSRAVAEVGAGWTSIDEAMLRATRRLARNGIDMIQYRDPTTGNKTVRNHVDVAVRRHVRTQLQQACAERTMQVCQRTGCGFVEVSSHYGARPSHQEWEGRVYSLKGRVTVDGVTYEDFGEGTGYYGTGPYAALGDRLCGVNCRHHWGPWFPGMPRAYHPNPKHPSGKTNEEIYELTQRQRALERELRATKRELSAALQAYASNPNLKNQAAANQLKARLKTLNDRMKKLVADNRDVITRQPNREYAGDMPRVSVPSEAEEHKVITGRAAGTDFDVIRRAVNGQAYREKFDKLSVPKKAGRTLYYETSEILRDCDGTAHERLAAVSWRSGRLVTDTMSQPAHDYRSNFNEEQREKVAGTPGGCILLHNHPGSSRPSWADIRSSSQDWVRASVVACHDGTIYELVCNDQTVIRAYDIIRTDVMASMPEVTDSLKIDDIATERLYKENKRAKWFRLRKI